MGSFLKRIVRLAIMKPKFLGRHLNPPVLETIATINFHYFNVVKATQMTLEWVGISTTFILISYPLLISSKSVVDKYGKF